MPDKAKWVDFKAARTVTTFPVVLGRYNINLRQVNGDHLRGRCPLPTHSSKESRDSFTVNLPKNIWSCKSDSCAKASGRRGGNMLDFVAIMENCALGDAAVKLTEWYGSEQKPEPAPVEAPKTANKPLGFILSHCDADHPYIRDKGIKLETALEFGVGFFPGKGSMAGRVVFPLYENGVLVGYAGRTIHEVTEDNPKWKLPAGLVKSFLFGLERCDPSKAVILCESPWAVLWFYQNRQPAAAIIGADLTEQQEKCLEPYGTIILALDNDQKGREATLKLAARLGKNHKVIKSFLRE